MIKPVTEAFSRELVFALDICEQAGRVAMRYFKEGQGVDAQAKDDGSPVTAADKECERLIREAIASRFPEDAMLGEEEGESKGSAGKKTKDSGKTRRWIIDPIDGTYGFARGQPIFATLLALEEDGEINLGVVHAPALQQTFWAEKGRGAFKNGERIYVSEIADLKEAQFNFGGLNRILDLGLWDGFTSLVRQTCRQRGPGDYLSFAQVFEGKAEFTIEVGVKPWDLAPMKIIATEAGGHFTDLKGKGSIFDGDCLVSNGLMHEQVLSILRSGG
jgi:histidinol-phosphatase